MSLYKRTSLSHLMIDLRIMTDMVMMMMMTFHRIDSTRATKSWGNCTAASMSGKSFLVSNSKVCHNT